MQIRFGVGDLRRTGQEVLSSNDGDGCFGVSGQRSEDQSGAQVAAQHQNEQDRNDGVFQGNMLLDARQQQVRFDRFEEKVRQVSQPPSLQD